MLVGDTLICQSSSIRGILYARTKLVPNASMAHRCVSTDRAGAVVALTPFKRATALLWHRAHSHGSTSC